jgi:hypothetical protein
MNLAQTLLGLGKGALNATGLPYLINTDIINPIKSATGQLTGNRIAMQNAEKAYAKPLPTQLKDWGVNSASALSLPFALDAAAGHIWKPPTAPIPPTPGLGMRVGPNERYTLSDFADYKMGRYNPHPQDLGPLAKQGWEIGKKLGLDVTSGSPAEINARIAQFLDRFGGL